MAHWNYKKGITTYHDPYDDPLAPGWEVLDCGCSGGLQWGGENPRECLTCEGFGVYYRHKKSRTLARYPGGPFLGKEGKKHG